ncbi:dynein axonemal heavy chain 6-like [Penaeus chinensis]|uniref:dynein axonemal heavy chain 6-like n=1 Tax=Penaeus chinensis TaxID=139456 RepID=UPI001FB75510|nr:dynein axonemal heavy chain 6-like [Penaeus chinensis]
MLGYSLGSRSPAPSDAFLDYANRVVATPELQAALTLLPQLLDVTCPILLYSEPGNGLTTFLDIFERHRAPATRVIRFRCTPLSTAQELFSCMIGDLLPSTPPADQSASSSGSDGESPIHDCLDPSMSQRDSFDNIPLLAPGDEGFSLLILEDVHLQLDTGGTLGTIWEIFRHMVEYGEVVCPSSGTRYRLQRVVPLLALSCHALPDQHVPARILRHCVVMGVPCISSRSCEHVVKVSLQDVLAELDEENFQPDATRDVVVELYQGLGASSRPQTGSRPRTASRTRASSRPQTASRSRPSSRPQTASRSRASSRPRTASRPQTASRPATAEPPDEATEGPLSGPASDKGSAKNSFDLPDLDTSTSNGSRLDTGRKSRSASHRNTLPNLHHLLQLTEALRKNARLLQMTLGQSASLIAFEARRIFSSVVESEEELSDRVFRIVKNKFEELEEGLAWWPGQTEEGKKMMTHAKDYNEFVKNIQYPDGLQQIMFTQTHFMALLKLVITMETFWSHAVVVGPPGVGKLSLVKLAAHYNRARVYHLDDYRDEASRVGALRSAVEASGVGGRRTVVVVRDHSVTPQLLDVLHSLAHTGWSETLLGRLRLRGLLEAIRLKGKELPRENKWMTYLEEDEVTSLRHRLITNVKRNLHVCLVSHSRHTSDSWCERYPALRSRWSWVRLDRWDSDTLRQVARRILVPYDIPPHILHQMQAALPSIHLMLAREKGVTVTVSDYVEACRVTVTLLARRRTELRESLSLFKGGMDKLQETGVNVEELKGELNELEPELKATQDEGNRLTQALAQHRNQVAQLRDQMVAQEERVKEKNDCVAAMNDEITQEIGEAMPALEATEKAVKALDKKDLVEVRVLNKPPDLVLAVMEPICILLNVKLRHYLKCYATEPKTNWGLARREGTGRVAGRFREACGGAARQQLDGGIKRATATQEGFTALGNTELTTVLACDEDSRWSAKIKTLMSEAEGVYGECTLGGVAVAYLGALTSSHRDQLLQSVVSILVTSGVVTPAKYDLMETLSTSEQRDTWEAADLYRDPACFLQAALVLSAIRRPLVLDPDHMCVRWLTRLHEEQGGLQVLHAGDEDLLSKVLSAAHARRPILVLHTPTYLTYNLRKLLEVPSHLQTSDGALQEVVMILVTGSATPTLPPELCVHVTRVSFALPPLVLEERLLNDVLKMEREDLYEQRASLTASIMRDQKALEAVDDTILKKLTQASTALLDNEELLAAFYEAKSTSAEFRTRLAECRRTLQKIGNVRDKYRPVATRGRLLFSTSTALRRLSRNYVFSFQHFLHLFSVCITSGGRTETLSFDQRIHSLVVSVTQLVVTHVSRALHPAHRLAFTTALCAAISADAGTLTPPAWRAVLDPSVLDERALVEAVMALEVDFGGVGEDLLKGVRLQLSLHDLVTEVGLTGSRGPAEMPRGRISDFNALMLLRIAKPRQLVAGAREVVNIMLGDPHLLRPDLALGKLLGPEERKLPVLVWADYGRDVAGEVIAAAHARSVAGITRVIMATPAEKAGELDSVGVPNLASLLVNSVQQGGWIIVQGAESPSVLSTLLGAMTSLGSPDVKVHEDFRLVVTVSVTKAAPPDLTLLARPLYSQPAPTIPATLAAAATLINMHNYRHHYSGTRWRRAVWQVAAAHTIASVTRHWHGHPPPPPVPPTHTPRTQMASGPSRPSSASPLPPTPTLELLDEPEAQASAGHVGLDGYVNLEELTGTLKCLYKLSLEYVLDDDTIVHFLAVVYGQQKAWQEIVCSIPGEVGVVSKEAAQSIVTAHLTACLQDLHNLTLDVEYRAFQDDLTTIASDIFEAPTSALDE